MSISIGNLSCGDNHPLLLIAGPCQIESLDHALFCAEKLSKAAADAGMGFIYKSSYDKANRTSASAARGIGMDEGLAVMAKVKDAFGCPVLSDVHLPDQCAVAAEVLDVLQIPAFLCRQTDLLVAAAKTGAVVNIKKGQFLAPWDMSGVLSKCTDAREVWITERGTSFGYNTLVVDYTGMQYMLDNFDCPVVFDATHSVQKPGGNGSSSGGNRAYVPGMARSAAALGVTNFFLEVHADPDNAPSDGPNMLRLEDFEEVVDDIHRYSYTC